MVKYCQKRNSHQNLVIKCSVCTKPSSQNSSLIEIKGLKLNLVQKVANELSTILVQFLNLDIVKTGVDIFRVHG